jgi:hypothetical protein
VTLSATPIPFNKGGVYRKGFWVWNETDEIWESFTTATCANEDINGNGILDDGEDINGDGFLTPGNIGPVPSTRTSDENGQILIDFLYPKEFGRWAEVEIIVKAESAGSESKDSKDFALGVLVDDLKVEGSPPPSSPWGSSASCTDTD